MNYLADKDKNPSAITLLQNLQHHTATLKPISFFSLSSFLVANLQMQALSNKGSLSLVAEMGNGRNPFGCCCIVVLCLSQFSIFLSSHLRCPKK